jgi:hypothetical protein
MAWSLGFSSIFTFCYNNRKTRVEEKFLVFSCKMNKCFLFVGTAHLLVCIYFIVSGSMQSTGSL